MKRLALITVLALSACTPPKPQGFGLSESPIRFETAKFDDPAQLAEVNGIKITSSQILDKSPVIKDLDQQRNESLIAMTYLKAVEKAGANAKGVVEVYLPATDRKLEALLARFDRKPINGVGLAFVKPSGDDDSLAGKLGAIEIKREDLDENNGVLQSIEQRRFNEVASQLNSQLSRILINEEAMKEKKPLQEFINEKVLKGATSGVSENELQAHLKKIGFAASELTPELKGQFITSLSQQKEQRAIEAYVAKNVLKAPVKVALRPPSTVIRLSDKWIPVAGYKDAPISMIAFSGTTCPDCLAFVGVVSDAMEKHKGYLKLNWIHNFNADDGVARMMAQAALCLDSQKAGYSLPFIDDFSAKAATLDENAFYSWVKDKGLNEGEFKACFVGQKQNELLDQHLRYAKQVGIVANPSLWIEGHMLEGVIRAEDVDRLVQEQIAEKQVSPIGAFFRRLFGKL